MLKRAVPLLVVCLALLGCNAKPPAAPVDTGSHAAAETYFSALLRKDWPAAFAALSPASRRTIAADRFARWAEDHRRRIGFEPDRVHLVSCVEAEGRAIAHVSFTGSRHHARFKDAATLVLENGVWSVSLPADFDRRRKT